MPIIKSFKSTNIWKAFFLNSIVTTIIVFIAITINETLNNYVFHIEVEPNFYDSNYKKHHKIKRINTFYSILLTIILTFLASMIAYIFMFLTFGFGGGMITIKKNDYIK